jgi:ribosomal protein S18 acetylase RimI-like enzyme
MWFRRAGEVFISVQIEYASEKRLASFYKALEQVASERIYLQMIEVPAFEKIQVYQLKYIQNNWPDFFAVENDEVIGWCEIMPKINPRLAHRGDLGMGVLKAHRGKGIGKQLLSKAIAHAKKIGLEKIELNVYTSNIVAIELYKKFGFKQAGFISHYRKLDGEYFDCLFMDLNL